MSCGKYPIIYRVLYSPGGLFGSSEPSTVLHFLRCSLKKTYSSLILNQIFTIGLFYSNTYKNHPKTLPTKTRPTPGILRLFPPFFLQLQVTSPVLSRCDCQAMVQTFAATTEGPCFSLVFWVFSQESAQVKLDSHSSNQNDRDR